MPPITPETTPETETAAPTSAESIAARIGAETVPAATAPAAQESAAPSPALEEMGVDSLGRAFDAAKFRPEKDSLGRWKNANVGRKPKDGAPAAAPKPAPAESFIPGVSAPPPAAPKAAAKAREVTPGPDRFALLGDVYTRAAIAAAMGALGPDWEPDDAAEYAGLRDSVAAYLRATNQEDLSPGWALVLAAGTYGARRLPREATQSRLAGLMAKLRAWWTGRSIARAVAAQPAP